MKSAIQEDTRPSRSELIEAIDENEATDKATAPCNERAASFCQRLEGLWVSLERDLIAAGEAGEVTNLNGRAALGLGLNASPFAQQNGLHRLLKSI
jgi:hypothetical protein